jgi:ribonuclease Z
MPRLVILGTASAVPDEKHDNTHMVLHGPHGSVLIDSGSSPLVALNRARVPHASLTAVIITHFHPDHVSGLPNFLQALWLLGRQSHLNIHGQRVTLDRFQALMSLFEWHDLPGFYPVTFAPVLAAENTLVLDTPDLVVHASPTHHFVPCLALRFTSKASSRSFVYSSDTSPCDALARLARGAEMLIHESAGAQSGHSSPSMAGSIARQAGVRHLVLIHYHVEDNPANMITEARSTFDGQITVAQDLDEFEF